LAYSQKPDIAGACPQANQSGVRLFFPIREAHCLRMLSAMECRAKADEAFAHAASSTDPYEKLNWQSRGQDWVLHAAQAEADEALERDFVNRSPN
jgi:hypothetical protein